MSKTIQLISTYKNWNVVTPTKKSYNIYLTLLRKICNITQV